MTRDDVRRIVEKRYRKLEEATWARFCRDGYVDEVLEDREDIDWLVEMLKDLTRAYGASSSGSSRSSNQPTGSYPAVDTVDQPGGWLAARANALVHVVAQLAASDGEVQQFRRQHDLEPVLAELDVLDWLQRCWERDRPVGWCWPDLTGSPHEGGRPWEKHDHVDLRCWVPLESAPWVAVRLPVPAQGTLADLAKLADQLAERYAWDVEQAATFVLTGLPPNYDGLSATTTIRGACPVASRIVLTIDPVVPPARVGAFYGKLRRQVLQLDGTGTGTGTTLAGERPSKRRVRPVSERSFALATFLAKRPKGESPAESHRVWNASRPEWQYSYGSFWRQDRALRQLAFPDYQRPEEANS